MKNWLVRIFALITLALALACAPTTQPAPDGTSPGVPTSETNIGGTVRVLGVWGGPELDSFKAVVQPFTAQTGIQMEFESTRDLDAVLTTRVQGNNPPDIAILPNPAKMQELAKSGKLVAMGSYLDSSMLQRNYAKSWVDLGSLDGKLYGLFFKAANKSTIWYNPEAFKDAGLSVPKTWDELMALDKKLVDSGKTPWSIGVDVGWPITDWIENILLRTGGPEVYDQWVSHKIKWTDPEVKKAFETFSQITGNSKNLLGGNQGAVATKFQDAIFPLYQDPPKAYLYYEGDFMQQFIKDQFPALKAGEDYAFFAFPPIDSKYGTPVVGGADVVVAFKDTPQVQAFVKYLSTPEAATVWVKRGGFTSPNKGVSLDAYPDALSRTSAQILSSAEVFRFDGSDLMPPALGSDAFFKQMQRYMADPTMIDQVLADLEQAASGAYR